MVKNTKGGNHKNFARKSINTNGAIRLPQEDGECLAVVEKMLGNCMCDVKILLPLPNDDTTLDTTPHTTLDTHTTTRAICNIRGKFRAHNKNHNLVTTNAIILVGIREWDLHYTHSHNTLKCDLLHIFQHNDISLLIHHNPKAALLIT